MTDRQWKEILQFSLIAFHNHLSQSHSYAMQSNSIQDETRKLPRQFANKDLGRLTDTDLQQREQLVLKRLQLK